MIIKKLRDNIITPTQSYIGDAGIDVYSPESTSIKSGKTKQIKLGLSIQIELNEVCVMSERSSQAMKCGVTSIGNIIDSTYSGEISIFLLNSGKETYLINEGDRIGQMVILLLGDRKVIVETGELAETNRSSNGYGSTGV